MIGKKYWLTWKSLMNTTKNSDMKFNTLLRVWFTDIFKEDGLMDKSLLFWNRQLILLNTELKADNLWKMQLFMGECSTDALTKYYTDKCPDIFALMGPSGLTRNGTDGDYWIVNFANMRNNDQKK